jgi:hypothetical protein
LDPIGTALFATLSPARALDVLILVVLLVAAHGAYSLARRVGADRIAALLAGIAFAGSGYVACQLKHLSILSTVAWLPYGLVLIDKAFAVASTGHTVASGIVRSRHAVLFGLVFAIQILAGFPQSAYICGLAYMGFAATLWVRDARAHGIKRTLAPALALTIAAGLAAGAGAILLLPLNALAAVSHRSGTAGYEWATSPAYWPPNVITFLIPYFFGDISDNTFQGPSVFWEDYGYIGVLPLVLALYAVARERPRAVLTYFKVVTLVAYLLVLGRNTPVFRIAYYLLPGLNRFRAPTRFLIVVELGLSILAAVGLARVRQDLAMSGPRRLTIATCAALSVVGLTTVDLYVHQPRQNPIVDAETWLSPPPSVRAILADSDQARTFTPNSHYLHIRAFTAAHGWTNVEPYYRLRDFLQPNIGGGFWALSSADCYAAVAPSWHLETWGEEIESEGLVSPLTAVDRDTSAIVLQPALINILKGYGVTHLLTSQPGQSGLDLILDDGDVHVYRVADARRVRLVKNATVVPQLHDAMERLRRPEFNFDAEVILHDVPPSVSTEDERADPVRSDNAVIESETDTHMTVRVDTATAAFLVLADTYAPGWRAEIDGAPAALYRANISVRAVPVPAGTHRVDFFYQQPGLAIGRTITTASSVTLIVWLLCAWALPRPLVDLRPS